MTILTTASFSVGEPQVSRQLAVFPVFGPEPVAVYRSLAQAVALGASVTEVDDGSIGDVLVKNSSDQALLVYEGEEITGARQNRMFDAPALVPPAVELTLPVSCVERGRWDGSRRRESFAPAASTADAQLRSVKRLRANRRAAASAPARADQGEVWHEVGARLACHAAMSSTDALQDVYRSRRQALDELRAAFHRIRGAAGVVVEICGRPVALDLVSRPEVFDDLFPRLLDGYALQALDAAAGETVNAAAARGFLDAVIEAPRRWLPTPGSGEGFAISQAGLTGCGLTEDRELVALSAFAVAGEPRPAA
jgi:hypothetical protein